MPTILWVGPPSLPSASPFEGENWVAVARSGGQDGQNLGLLVHCFLGRLAARFCLLFRADDAVVDALFSQHSPKTMGAQQGQLIGQNRNTV